MNSALVAPADGPLGAALTERLVASGCRVVEGVIAEGEASSTAGHTERRDELDPSGNGGVAKDPVPASKDRITVRWNPGSFISARNLVLTAVNTFDSIDAVIVVHEPHAAGKVLHECSPAWIEQQIDTGTKGVALLLREALGALVRQRNGTLAMVLYAPEEPFTAAVTTTTRAAFTAMSESLSVVYENEPVHISTFDARRADLDGFSAYIETNLEKGGSGRSFRYGSSPFGRLGIGGR